jgi:hypothetical protein
MVEVQMAQFSDREQDGGTKNIAASSDRHDSHSQPEKRLRDDRIHQTFIKHYFNHQVEENKPLKRYFERAWDTIKDSFKNHSDVYWIMREAAQFRDLCAPSDRAWQEPKDFWFMLCDPEEPSVPAYLPAYYQEAVAYALRDYPPPDMSGNLAQAHISVAKTMIARSATFAVKELSITNALEDQITAAAEQAERLIKEIEDAVETAKIVYENACRDAARAHNRIREPARAAVGSYA